MKRLFLALLILLSFAARCQQQDSAATPLPVKHVVFERYSTIATLSVGGIDYYKQNYTLPEGFAKSNTSGFAPFYVKLEYGVSNRISIAATLAYDAFDYNYNQFYSGNTGTFTRYRTDKFRIFSGGITAFYHLGFLLRVHSLDPFVGVGLALNNLRYAAYPQGDSSVVNLMHTVSPSLRVGARYYISGQCSFFGDLGYDKQSIFSLGISCRFFNTHKKITRDIDSDGDGIPDKVDSCPHQRGLPQFNGCPDTDGDGIPDSRDSCPTVAGPAGNHGCPYDSVTSKKVIEAKAASIPADVIRFLPATAIIKDSSLILLDSIVAILKGNSKMDVSIETYKDEGTPEKVSRKTANARAVAIKKYLVDKGIGVTRLIFSRSSSPAKAKKHREITELKYDLTY